MTIFDISVPLSKHLPTYEGDPPFDLNLWASMAKGDLADVRTVAMGVHTGTHVDAPAHFVAGGRSIDEAELETLYGPAQVIDVTEMDGTLIGHDALERGMTEGITRVLLKTTNSSLWKREQFEQGFTALAPDGAQYLVERGVKLVGIDYLSIAPFGDPAPVHRLLLEAGAVIVEGLDLSQVSAGMYTLACLPLRLAGAEAAPARAILISA